MYEGKYGVMDGGWVKPYYSPTDWAGDKIDRVTAQVLLSFKGRPLTLLTMININVKGTGSIIPSNAFLQPFSNNRGK